MNNRIVFPVWCMVGLLIVTSVNADIVITGEFTGSFSDDFESYPNYTISGSTLMGSLDNLSIAGGAAELRSVPVNTSQVWIYDTTQFAWSLDAYGSALARSGQQGLGFYVDTTPAITATVDLFLTNPVSRVGIYYATDSNGIANDSDMLVSVFESGAQSGVDFTLDSGGNAFQWAGWESDVGIERIRLSGNLAPVFDDFQAVAVAVPEPSTLVLLGLVGMAFVTKRRRRMV